MRRMSPLAGTGHRDDKLVTINYGLRSWNVTRARVRRSRACGAGTPPWGGRVRANLSDILVISDMNDRSSGALETFT